MAQEKAISVIILWVGKVKEIKTRGLIQSQSIDQGSGQSEISGLAHPNIPVCSQSNIVTQKSVLTLQNLLYSERKNYTGISWCIHKVSLIPFFFP